MLFNLIESNGMVYEFSDTFLNEWEKRQISNVQIQKLLQLT